MTTSPDRHGTTADHNLPDEALELIEDRLAGDLDDALWHDACQRWGPDLEQSYRSAAEIRQQVAALPTPSLPPALQQAAYALANTSPREQVSSAATAATAATAAAITTHPADTTHQTTVKRQKAVLPWPMLLAAAATLMISWWLLPQLTGPPSSSDLTPAPLVSAAPNQEHLPAKEHAGRQSYDYQATDDYEVVAEGKGYLVEETARPVSTASADGRPEVIVQGMIPPASAPRLELAAGDGLAEDVAAHEHAWQAGATYTVVSEPVLARTVTLSGGEDKVDVVDVVDVQDNPDGLLAPAAPAALATSEPAQLRSRQDTLAEAESPSLVAALHAVAKQVADGQANNEQSNNYQASSRQAENKASPVIDDAAMAELLTQAKQFDRDGVSTNEPSDGVRAEALRLQLRQLVQQEQAQPTLHNWQLAIVLSLQRDSEDHLIADIQLDNLTDRQLPVNDRLLTIVGIDADGSIIWRQTLPGPTTPVAAGGQHRWLVPLRDARQPPPTMVGVIVISAGGHSEPVAVPAPRLPLLQEVDAAAGEAEGARDGK